MEQRDRVPPASPWLQAPWWEAEGCDELGEDGGLSTQTANTAFASIPWS